MIPNISMKNNMMACRRRKMRVSCPVLLFVLMYAALFTSQEASYMNQETCGDSSKKAALCWVHLWVQLIIYLIRAVNDRWEKNVNHKGESSRGMSSIKQRLILCFPWCMGDLVEIIHQFYKTHIFMVFCLFTVCWFFTRKLAYETWWIQKL